MIVKIQQPNPSILAAVRYNENKMNGTEGPRPSDAGAEELAAIEDGHVLATRNVGEDGSLVKEFQRLELLARKKGKTGPQLQNSSFHMSVNPADDDRKLSEEETVRLIDEIMEGLGYGKQPYRIYAHTDIPRKHYHVVSCRIGQDGKKINDSFEWMRLRKLLRTMEEKYGFEIILNDHEKEREGYKTEKKNSKNANATTEKASSGQDDNKKKFVPPFSRNDGRPVTEQMRSAVEDALKWHFSTFEQLQMLMLRRYNIIIEVEKDVSDGKIVMQGTDSKANPVTPPIHEAEIQEGLMESIREKAYKEKMRNRREQRERLEKLACAAAAASNNYDEFLRIMEKKGVWVILSWSPDSAEPFGLTYLDRATKCAWKGSETAVNLQWLKEKVQEKGWTLEKDHKNEITTKRNKMPSRTRMVAKEDFAPIAVGTDGRTARLANTGKTVHPRLGAKRDRNLHGSNADVNKEKDGLGRKEEDKNIKYVGE